MKICTKCLIEKVETEFNWKNKSKNIRQWVCRPCHSAYLKEHYKTNPQTYINSSKKRRLAISEFVRNCKNVPCKDCGVSYPHYVMDFDHRDKKDKRFILSKYNQIGSLTKIKAEISKCDVVCANCHRKRTYERVTIKEDGTVF